MLTDNAIELFLHRMARDKSSRIKLYRHLRESYLYEAALDKALGRSFDAKVRFATLDGNLGDDGARTISVLHEYRNEVYHVGIQHEAILPSLARFYLHVTCGYLKGYAPPFFGWSSNESLPERAKKYFHGPSFMPGQMTDFGAGCAVIADACGHDPATTISVLADHMDEVIELQDSCIDTVAGGVYQGQQTTRDKAVIHSQTWPLAHTDEGRTFGVENGYTGSTFDFVEWLAAHYPLEVPRDPIPSWRRRATKLRALTNPHGALNQYHSFMMETARIRDAIYDAAAQVEAGIENAIDRARGR
jgi:hypothetical protein